MSVFLKTLKKWLADSYECLGLVLIASLSLFGVVLACFAVAAKLVSFGPFFAVVWIIASYILLIAPVIAGGYYLARRIIIRDEPSVSVLLKGVRELLTASWGIALLQVIITTAIAVNAWFYLSRGVPVLTMLGTLFIYLMLLWMLSSVYHFPVLVEQRPGAFKTIKRGFLLVLDNIAFTGGVFFVIILLTCLCTVTFLGLPFLYLGMVSLLQTRAFRVLLVKYEILPPEREPGTEEESQPQNTDSADQWPTFVP